MTARDVATRRHFLQRSGLGFGAAALATLFADEARGNPGVHTPGSPDPLAEKPSHFAPRAKRVIYLHMIGAPSYLDLFDHKPELKKRDGQECPAELLAGRRFAFIGGKMTLAGSRYNFARHGKSGLELSELLPHLATVADDIAVPAPPSGPESSTTYAGKSLVAEPRP